jgi:hypothetical protein
MRSPPAVGQQQTQPITTMAIGAGFSAHNVHGQLTVCFFGGDFDWPQLLD